MFHTGQPQTAVPQGGLDSVVRIVTEFLQKQNINPDNQKLKLENGEIGWTINRGSSINYIIITKVNGIDTLRVASPILFLPQDNLLPLYRRCLELNFIVLNCAFAINKDMIVVVSERAAAGLDAAEFESMLRQVSFIADHYDDKLAQEFGARLYSQGR